MTMYSKYNLRKLGQALQFAKDRLKTSADNYRSKIKQEQYYFATEIWMEIERQQKVIDHLQGLYDRVASTQLKHEES